VRRAKTGIRDLHGSQSSLTGEVLLAKQVYVVLPFAKLPMLQIGIILQAMWHMAKEQFKVEAWILEKQSMAS
jgi:hypothetical protein